MEASRCIFDTEVFSHIHSKQLHGHIRRTQRCRSDYRLRHVLLVPTYLQGPRKWLENRRRNSAHSWQLSAIKHPLMEP
jgi:hypothetical protein